MATPTTKTIKMFSQRLYLADTQIKLIRDLMSQTREWRNEIVRLLQNNYVFTNKFEVAECILGEKGYKAFKEKYYLEKKEWVKLSKKDRDDLYKARDEFEINNRIENLLWLKTNKPLEISDITNSPSITKEDKYSKDEKGNILYETVTKPDGKQIEKPIRLTSAALALLRKERRNHPDYIKGYVYEFYLNENQNPDYNLYKDLQSLSYWESVRNVFANYKSRLTNLSKGNIKYSKLKEYFKDNIIFYGKGLSIFKDTEILRSGKKKEIHFLYIPKHKEQIKIIIEDNRLKDFCASGDIEDGKVENLKILNGRIFENNAGEFYAALCLEYEPNLLPRTEKFIGIDPNSNPESALTLSDKMMWDGVMTDILPYPNVKNINKKIFKVCSKQSKARDLHGILQMKFNESKNIRTRFLNMKLKEKETIGKRKLPEAHEKSSIPERKYYNLGKELPANFSGKNQAKLKVKERKLRQKRDNTISSHWKKVCYELFKQFDYVGIGDWGGHKDKELRKYETFNEDIGHRIIAQKIRHNLQNDMNLGYFKSFANWKAKEAGKVFVEILEPYTTQKHFECKAGNYYNSTDYILGKLRYRCQGCGKMIDNDKNAAWNIHAILEKGIKLKVAPSKFNIRLLDPEKEIKSKLKPNVIVEKKRKKGK